MTLERGELLSGRYRIIEILGQGGMGSVYRAIDENLGVEVAVKDNLFTTEEYARQFRREAVILANLRHPNLPRVTDHFVVPGLGQYLVMDYIEGEDLRQRMDRMGILDDEEVITIGAAVCDALTYLDAQRPSIVHRDIKPGNIKITSEGKIFLVDFGLAKVMEGVHTTTTGARAMTPGYSPPEQYGTARTDQRSDIFSLGATLYAALTEAVPEDALARAMEQTELTGVRKRNPKVSRRLASVIEKSLSIRPNDRYQDAESFKQALLSARSNTGKRMTGDLRVSPPPDTFEKPLPGDNPHISPEAAEVLPRSISPDHPLPMTEHLESSEPLPRRSRSARRRSLTFWPLFSILLLFLLVGGGTAVIWTNPQFPDNTLAMLRNLGGAASPTPTASSPAPTVPPVLQASATPTRTAHPTATPAPPTSTHLAIVPPATVFPTITSLPTITMTPQATPQGGGSGQIAFAANLPGAPQIFLTDINGNSPVQLTDLNGGACQPDWSPDGTRLIFISPCDSNHELYPGSAMFIINVDRTGLTPLATMPGGDFDPDWSPDGKTIAFTSIRNSGRPQIYLYDLETNKVSLLSERYSSDSQPDWSTDGRQIVFSSTRNGEASSQLWLMEANGSNQHVVTHNNDLFDTHPSWAPQGRTILFTQATKSGGIPKLMLLDLDGESGSSERRITTDQLPMREGHFSPDGLWIIFEGWPAGSHHDIYIIAVNGAARRAVTTDMRNDFDPAWHPGSPVPPTPAS